MAKSKSAKYDIKKILLISCGALTLAIIVFALWLWRLDKRITVRLEQGRFAPAVEFFAAPLEIRAGYTLPPKDLENFFSRHRFTERGYGKNIEPGEFSVWSQAECLGIVPELANEVDLSRCVAFKNVKSISKDPTDTAPVQILALGADGRKVLATFSGAPPVRSELVSLEPELFAQYYGDRPILREEVPLANAPAQCLNALLAIEDAAFLEHSGISPQSLLRAAWSIVRHGRVTQGGSTLTQQTVKNFFLTDERTLKRKIPEFFMSLLLEGRLSKDQILQIYINTIYMGQNGVFEIRGFGSAARHYFGSDLQDLDLPQCSLLAAIVNSPGLFNPFTKPDNALKRRNRVLERMKDLKFIDEAEWKSATAAKLPTKSLRGLTEPAPYFVQTIRRQLEDKGIDETEGLRIYTTLNLRAQEEAYQAVRVGLERLETTNKHIKALKEKGKNLEAILLASDPATGHVLALVGGRGFKRSPYNRAFDSQRQVGSVMKPFVYLAALEGLDPEGKPYNALSAIDDSRFTHKYQGQSWSPGNYDGKFHGPVPLYFALKESLNVPAAKLAISVGLDNVVDISRRMGIQSKITPLPSISLGAFELHPWEVLQAYGAIAAEGRLAPVTFILRVEDLGGAVLFENEDKSEQVAAPEPTTQLIAMMEQTIRTGSARGARLSGFTHPSAGKTGTTNDKKDAWFAGFTPYHVAVVWVGYDDNTTHNLTGGGGAVPIWTQYMKNFAMQFPPDEFPLPESVERVVIPVDLQSALGVPTKEGVEPEDVNLVFLKGQAPEGSVPATPPSEVPLETSPTPNPMNPSGL